MNFMHQYHSVSTHCVAVVVTAVVAGIAAGVRVRMMIFHVKISIFESQGGGGIVGGGRGIGGRSSGDGSSGGSKEEESNVFHVRRSCFLQKLRSHRHRQHHADTWHKMRLARI